MTAAPGRTTVRAARWVVDPHRSRATFSVGNLGLRTVRGAVPVLGGSLGTDDGGVPRAVRAELDLGRIDTGNARRDADLRKPHLLDLDAHPRLTFECETFEWGPQGWTGLGRLSARGRTCPLAVLGVPATAEDDELHVVGTAVLDRAQLGIRAPRLLIGREVAIVVDCRLTAG